MKKQLRISSFRSRNNEIEVEVKAEAEVKMFAINMVGCGIDWMRVKRKARQVPWGQA